MAGSSNHAIQGPLVAIADGTYELAIPSGYVHCFGGVKLQAGTDENAPAIEPTAGTLTFMIQPVFLTGLWRPFEGNTVTLPSLADDIVSWSVNASRLQCAIAGLTGTGATHFRLWATCNGS